MCCINMLFENLIIHKKPFRKTERLFLLPTTTGGNFGCGAICACCVGRLRLSAIKSAGHSRYKCEWQQAARLVFDKALQNL